MPNYDDKDIIIYRPKQASGKYSDVDYYREDIMFPSLTATKQCDGIQHYQVFE